MEGFAHKKSWMSKSEPFTMVRQCHFDPLRALGAGFGGLKTAQGLRLAACRVTVIDKRNYHLFQPLLYQVATASLSPADIAASIQALFRDPWPAPWVRLGLPASGRICGSILPRPRWVCCSRRRSIIRFRAAMP